MKQRHHFRRYRNRSVLVNAGHYPMRKTIVSRKGSLSKDKRIIFSNIARHHNKEVGGYMDFNKRGLENANMYFGTVRSVDIPDEDYEVDWHTHPQHLDVLTNKLNRFPSVDDMEDLLQIKGRQASMVFNNEGNIIVITKTPRTKAYMESKHDLKNDLKHFDEFLEAHINDEKLLEKINQENVFGFRFTKSPEGSISVPIKVTEFRK